MSSDIPLIDFAQTLAGKYSNREQAQDNPRCFAHINIYYRPLDWPIINGPWFYSEQSYDCMPWSPYKQAIHRLIHFKNTFIVENYYLKSPERVAGSGFKPELLKDLNREGFSKRDGCSMYFTEIKNMHYKGNVEPGNQCLINRKGVITYLVSNVEFNEKIWTSLDEGIDACSHKKIWGSVHGKLEFRKVERIGIDLIESWRRNLYID